METIIDILLLGLVEILLSFFFWFFVVVFIIRVLISFLSRSD